MYRNATAALISMRLGRKLNPTEEAALSLATLTYNLTVLFQRHLGWQTKVTVHSLRFWRSYWRDRPPRQEAIVMLSAMVGAVALSRAVDDAAFSDEILAAISFIATALMPDYTGKDISDDAYSDD